MARPRHDVRKLLISRSALDDAFAQARAERIAALMEWKHSGGHISPAPSWELVDPKGRYAAVVETYRYYDFLSRLGYSPSLFENIEWMKTMPHGKSAGRVTNVLQWLEEDPFCLHSGFYKQRVLRLLRRFEFTAEQAEHMRRIALSAIQRGPRKEFRELCRLTARMDSPELRAALERLVESADEGTAWRAGQLLGACDRIAARASGANG